MFESVMVTTAFRAGKTVDMPGLTSHNFHFALNQNTNKQTMSDYLNWFVALRLLDATAASQVMNQVIGGGQSTCLLRTEFDDKACQSMFLTPRATPGGERLPRNRPQGLGRTD